MMRLGINLSRLICLLYGPVDLSVSDLIISKASSLGMQATIKLQWFLFFRYASGGIGVSGIS